MQLQSSEVLGGRRPVRLGKSGLVGPEALTVNVSGLGPHDAQLEVLFSKDRYVCRQLTLVQRDGGPPVTAESLRQVVLSQAVQWAVWGHLKVLEEEPGGAQSMTPLGTLPADVSASGPTSEALRWLAYIYTWAYATGLPPTKTVMDTMKLPRGTAARWLAMARDAGLVGSTTERKAGT